MPASAPLTDDDVLSLLGQSRSPLSLREIATRLTLRHAGRRSLAKIVSRLKRRGIVQELSGARYALAGGRPTKQVGKARSTAAGKAKGASASSPSPAAGDPNLLVGRLVAHRDGYGFVVPETPRRDHRRRPLYSA